MSSIAATQAIETVNNQPGRRQIGRRVAAVLAGLVANIIAASATDALLRATGVYPPFGVRMSGTLFAIALAYRAMYGVLGSYLTARLAPDRPMQHALALGVIGVLIGTVGAAVMWDAGPAWYSLGVIAVTFPSVWVGARLLTRSTKQ